MGTAYLCSSEEGISYLTKKRTWREFDSKKQQIAKLTDMQRAISKYNSVSNFPLSFMRKVRFLDLLYSKDRIRTILRELLYEAVLQSSCVLADPTIGNQGQIDVGFQTRSQQPPLQQLGLTNGAGLTAALVHKVSWRHHNRPVFFLVSSNNPPTKIQ